MSKSIWDEFDEQYNVEGLQEDAKEAAENGGGDFKEVPDGEYEVGLEKLELKKSKSGKPMVSAWFNIVDGDNKGQKIFYNQVIDQGFGLHMSNEFLRSLGTEVDIEFNSFAQYAKMLEDVKSETDVLEFALDYGHNQKGFGTYEITDIFEKEEE